MHTLPNIPIVLTIAGFDPSGCAGILADVKTFEANGAYGMAACTANTEQNVAAFNKANWIKKDDILGQLNLLQQEVNFEFVKIGLIENFDVLNSVIDELVKQNSNVKIIWDPVCKASAGFGFHTEIQKQVLEKICAKLYLITPNLDEQKILTRELSVEDAGKYLSQFCNVLIKGGHSTTAQSNDILFTETGIHHFEAVKLDGYSKRGTGCVLSSAILAHLAQHETLTEACAHAKNYIHHYLTGNHSLIGTHSYADQ
jgi:hydroxymethylpyrimidine/phosphomethylpyrimidine kinase